MYKQNTIFKILNYTIFIMLGCITLYPFWHVLMGSFMSYSEYSVTTFKLFVKQPTLIAYLGVLSENNFLIPLGNSIFVTVVGTAISIMATTMAAYSMSKRYLYGRKIIMIFIIITMLFSGGLIPTYLVMRYLHLIDSLWVLILPGMVNAYYLIVVRTYFSGLPESLTDSARIDGCGDFRIFVKLFLPISMPMVATIILFLAVDRWNELFSAIIYIYDSKKMVLQVMLYKMIASKSSESFFSTSIKNVQPETKRMAATIITTVPILIVYPFLQKHFVKGVLIGSIKE